MIVVRIEPESPSRYPSGLFKINGRYLRVVPRYQGESNVVIKLGRVIERPYRSREVFYVVGDIIDTTVQYPDARELADAMQHDEARAITMIETLLMEMVL